MRRDEKTERLEGSKAYSRLYRRNSLRLINAKAIKH